MKMIYGGTPVESLKVRHYEVSTNDCDMVASDLQAGKTAVARGQKITGTGKCFSFAFYGSVYTNVPIQIPSTINVVEVASLDYPVQLAMALNNMYVEDFSKTQNIANIVIGGQSYPLMVTVTDNKMTISCSKTIKLQIFYGRDNYV